MLKIIQDLLEAGKITAEVATQVDTEVSKMLKELRDESASWRVKYQDVSKNLTEITNSKSTLEEQLKELNSKIEVAKESGKKEMLEVLNKEKSEKETLMSKLQELETTSKNLKIENELSKELASYDLIDKDIVMQVLKMDLDLVDDNIKFKNGLPLKDGLEKFFKEKPHLLKATTGTGSGAGNNPQNGFAENSLTAKILQNR